MFSKFFEKTKSNGQVLEYYRKRKREAPQPNLSYASGMKGVSSTSHSPSLNRTEKMERKGSPGLSNKNSPKTSSKKVKKIVKLDYSPRDRLERPKSSKSPKPIQKDFYEFFANKGLAGLGQLADRVNKLSKPQDDSFRTRSTSKKLLSALQSGAVKNKVQTTRTSVSKKPSRDTSLKTKKLPDSLSLKKVQLESSKLHEKEKKKSSLNTQFLSCAKKDEAEKCLQMITSDSRGQKGANINCQDKDGWTALHYACWNENLKFVNILLYNDANHSKKDVGGLTPLFLAIAKGNSTIAKVLINAGASINEIDNQGNSVLHHAAATKHKNCIDLLIQQGASLDIRNQDGHTPLELVDDSLASLFQPMKMTQSKHNTQEGLEQFVARGAKKSSSETPAAQKRKLADKEEYKSTNMESNYSASKSIFSTKSVVKPRDFTVHCLLGTGSFGEVYLVEKKDSGRLYAMKVLSKENVFRKSRFYQEHNLQRYALTEKTVLSSINHPFIVRLRFAFQTSSKLFMILDFCPGGDLGQRLQEEGCFSEERTRIYLAEVLLALEELHSRDIIYRDLKPDNILLDQDGHAMLTDFGLSKQEVTEYFTGAKSFCGSVAYLAPEMLKRAGHGKAVDWYLLGVVMYEMLTGYPPYYAESKDELFNNIEHAPLKLPSGLSSEAKSLLKSLLDRDPSKRLGAGTGGIREIKEHAFFQGIDWSEVRTRQLAPPKPVFNINLSKKNIPKDLLLDTQDGKNQVLGWSFKGEED